MSKIVKPTISVKAKEQYRLSNWWAYNQGIKQGGSLTLWLSEALAQQWYYQGQPTKGGQFIYSNACILLLLTLKVTFRLAFGQLAGFASSLMTLFQLDLQVPGRPRLITVRFVGATTVCWLLWVLPNE